MYFRWTWIETTKKKDLNWVGLPPKTPKICGQINICCQILNCMHDFAIKYIYGYDTDDTIKKACIYLYKSIRPIGILWNPLLKGLIQVKNEIFLLFFVILTAFISRILHN